MNRRKFLKIGVSGACALCASRVIGNAVPRGAGGGAASETAQKGFTRPVRAQWFSAVGKGRIRCELCPRLCELADGERAMCRVRENRGGEGYTLAHGNPVLVQDDPIERKPFFHVLPGSRALSVSTAGCNLECKFCEVWDMALAAPEEVHAYDMPPETLAKHAESARVSSVSYAFGEPVVFYEYMSAIASLVKEAGLLNLVHTAGYIRPDPLRRLSGFIDAANVDLKSFDPAFYRDVVGGELEPVLKTLKQLEEAGVHIEITNIVIPTLNDDMKTISEMCKWIAGELGAGVPVHFARFYPLYKLSALPRTPVSTLERARETASEAGLEFVYLARVSGHEAENTFCPDCGKIVVGRVGFVVTETHLEDGKCGYCGRKIPGRWD